MYDAMNHAFAQNYLAALKNVKNTSEPDTEKCRKTYIPWQRSEMSEGVFLRTILAGREQETAEK